MPTPATPSNTTCPRSWAGSNAASRTSEAEKYRAGDGAKCSGFDLPLAGRGSARKERSMLLALIALLVLVALVGGITVHPLLFLILLLAVILFFGGRRGAVY